MKKCSWQEPDDYCFNSAEGNTDYCASHGRRIRKANSIEYENNQIKYSKPKAPIKKVSDKRKELNKEYFKLVERFKIDNPNCIAKINEHCTRLTDDPHHKKGRGKYLLDVSLWVPVCRSCHQYIEQNPLDAIKRGLSFSRLSIQMDIVLSALEAREKGLKI